MKTNQDTCQNCEKPYEEGFQFCPHCGQKTNDELTLGVLFYNTISNYFSFDARFLKSFIPLMFRPGYLAKEFIKGKRLLYLHPAQMYLFVAVIFFFIFNFYVREGREKLDENMQRVLESRSEKLANRDSLVPQDSLDIKEFVKPLQNNAATIGLDEDDLKVLDSVANIKVPKKNMGMSYSFNEKDIDSLIAAGASDKELYKALGMDDDAGFFQRKFYGQILKFYKTMGLGQIFQAFIDSIPLAMFFLLPIFAFLLKLFFFNKGRYSHHLVFSFYYFSFLFVVFSLIFGVNRFWQIPDWIDWLIAFSTFFYLLVAIIKFYGQNWFLSFIKSGMVSFMFLWLVLPLSFVLLGFIAFLFY
ncbi:DUF3667 domain-containing protein [Winogradskyella flava]|uniref:DUF3667 domain-containing protein n=1 Tax=Winogradskyella flava TaxID=1884876 RepID=A0A842IT13_9FLAO|nr:DUF3667 domain-containing protein [Winogradskyella flava]MBC2844936.1 DUF3667 domain-containing protein [Winogradskyella flava]